MAESMEGVETAALAPGAQQPQPAPYGVAPAETPAPTDQATADQDVKMEDAPDGEAQDDGDEDAEGEADDDLDVRDADALDVKNADTEEPAPSPGEGGPRQRTKNELLDAIAAMSTYLCELTDEDGAEIAAGFQRLPNKRVLPDYFEVIHTPAAFSTIRGKLLRKTYTNYGEFVRDVAQICHNAQVYNRPSAPIFHAATKLRDAFKNELTKLAEKGEITAAEAELPYLGEIPTEESPGPEGEDGERGGEEEGEEEEEEGEEEEEEEADEGQDEDEDSGHRGGRGGGGRGGGARGGRRRGGAAAVGRDRNRDKDKDKDKDKDDDTHKRRGRPPKVFTPTEARINNILRGLRRFKDQDGELLVLEFEKLPDKAANPDYYRVIEQPLALDHVKRRAKRKKYGDVDALMGDLELLFDNARRYNEEESAIHKAAVELQSQARQMAAHEKARPDEDFGDDEGKLPLARIEHLGETWQVGDWVHVRNPNDLSKPTVAQVFRMWQDRAGMRWINACWYFRPEQTVHRFDKHFFEHEVVKTGQYRDHLVDEIVGRCFVMFVTRYPKGRPRGFPPDRDIYVCESRYNEERATFNKIKTWASCVPDEVRELNYEMTLFQTPCKMRKAPSPIKHLLRPDAEPTDELPKPTWGAPNAPPIIGAVHNRPRNDHDSAPPSPTPPPSAALAPPASRNVSGAAAITPSGPGHYGGLHGAHGHGHGATPQHPPGQYPQQYPQQYLQQHPQQHPQQYSGHNHAAMAVMAPPMTPGHQTPGPHNVATPHHGHPVRPHHPQQHLQQPHMQQQPAASSPMPLQAQQFQPVPHHMHQRPQGHPPPHGQGQVPIRPQMHGYQQQQPPPHLAPQGPPQVVQPHPHTPYGGSGGPPGGGILMTPSQQPGHAILAPRPGAGHDAHAQRRIAPMHGPPPPLQHLQPQNSVPRLAPSGGQYAHQAAGGAAYVPPRPAEVYTLPDPLNDNIPAEVRKLLQKDEAGRVLFFRNAPLHRPGNGIAGDAAGLGHSIRYLAAKRRQEMAAKNDDVDENNDDGHASPAQLPESRKRKAEDQQDRHWPSEPTKTTWDDVEKTVRETCAEFDAATARWRKESGIDEWDQMMAPVRAAKKQREAERREEARRRVEERRQARRGVV